MGGDERRAELSANLADVRARLAAACADAGRAAEEVTLIVVTKTWPASDVVHLSALGVGDVGENRDQEAAPKAGAVRDAGADVRWHFVGRLQRNKCSSVVHYAAAVHSVDSVRLADALAEAVAQHDRAQGGGPLDVLVQVSIDDDPGRGGAVADSTATPDIALDRVLARVDEAPGLALRGLMAVAPLHWEPARAFAKLAEISARARRDHPQATLISAGMSGDVEQAIHHGATHVRMGSAVLGNRPVLM